MSEIHTDGGDSGDEGVRGADGELTSDGVEHRGISGDEAPGSALGNGQAAAIELGEGALDGVGVDPGLRGERTLGIRVPAGQMPVTIRMRKSSTSWIQIGRESSRSMALLVLGDGKCS